MDSDFDILDEHLTRRVRKEKLCKRLKFYTLLFTGAMAIIYLIFNLLNWPYGKYLLLLGLVSISIQSTFCFLRMRPRTWMAGIRALLSVLATIYLLWLFSA